MAKMLREGWRIKFVDPQAEKQANRRLTVGEPRPNFDSLDM
jgi:hypothetical protein